VAHLGIVQMGGWVLGDKAEAFLEM